MILLNLNLAGCLKGGEGHEPVDHEGPAVLIAVIEAPRVAARVHADLEFDGSNSTADEGQQITNHTFHFDDSSWLSGPGPPGKVNHNWDKGGYYNVSLKVTQTDGAHDNRSLRVRIIPLDFHDEPEGTINIYVQGQGDEMDYNWQAESFWYQLNINYTFTCTRGSGDYDFQLRDKDGDPFHDEQDSIADGQQKTGRLQYDRQGLDGYEGRLQLNYEISQATSPEGVEVTWEYVIDVRYR